MVRSGCGSVGQTRRVAGTDLKICESCWRERKEHNSGQWNPAASRLHTGRSVTSKHRFGAENMLGEPIRPAAASHARLRLTRTRYVLIDEDPSHQILAVYIGNEELRTLQLTGRVCI